MNINKIWYNDNFWFRLSIIAVALWLILSLAISLIAYFSWVHHFEAFRELLVEFSTWFFLLPSIALFGVLNAVPFVAPWLFETLAEEAAEVKETGEAKTAVAKESYTNLTSRLQAGVEE